jgi:hypothetical protein
MCEPTLLPIVLSLLLVGAGAMLLVVIAMLAFLEGFLEGLHAERGRESEPWKAV